MSRNTTPQSDLCASTYTIDNLPEETQPQETPETLPPTLDTPFYYHASWDNLGPVFSFDSGGRYEKIVDGHAKPQYGVGHDDFIGFAVSDTPEFCASQSITGAAFAKLYSISLDLHPPYNATTVRIYALSRSPNVVITDQTGDFPYINEVRYRNPSSNPVTGVLVRSLTFPGKALADLQLAYLPYGPYVIHSWAEAVKQGIQRVVRTGIYPDDISAEFDVTTPEPEAYRNARVG